MSVFNVYVAWRDPKLWIGSKHMKCFISMWHLFINLCKFYDSEDRFKKTRFISCLFDKFIKAFRSFIIGDAITSNETIKLTK